MAQDPHLSESETASVHRVLLYLMVVMGAAVGATSWVWPAAARANDDATPLGTLVPDDSLIVVHGLQGYVFDVPYSRIVLFLAFFGGILGGAVYALVRLGKHAGEKTYERSYTTWYIAHPFLGGGLALGVYGLLRSLSDTVDGMTTLDIPTTPWAPLGWGILVGLNYRQALGWIASKARLHLPSPDDRFHVHRVEVKDGRLWVTGQGFDAGTRVRADGQSLRLEGVHPHRLEARVSEVPKTVEVQLRDGRSYSGRVDVMDP